MSSRLAVSMASSMIWSRLDGANTMIAIGDKILTESNRARVRLDSTGSVLTITLAGEEDAGGRGDF